MKTGQVIGGVIAASAVLLGGAYYGIAFYGAQQVRAQIAKANEGLAAFEISAEEVRYNPIRDDIRLSGLTVCRTDGSGACLVHVDQLVVEELGRAASPPDRLALEVSGLRVLAGSEGGARPSSGRVTDFDLALAYALAPDRHSLVVGPVILYGRAEDPEGRGGDDLGRLAVSFTLAGLAAGDDPEARWTDGLMGPASEAGVSDVDLRLDNRGLVAEIAAIAAANGVAFQPGAVAERLAREAAIAPQAGQQAALEALAAALRAAAPNTAADELHLVSADRRPVRLGDVLASASVIPVNLPVLLDLKPAE